MSTCPGPCSPLSVTPSQWSGGPDRSPVSAAELLAGPGDPPLSGVSLLRPHSFRVCLPASSAGPELRLGKEELWGCCLEAPLLLNSENQEPALHLPRVGED